ncbi:MAG: serine/threonine protein kinase [Ruminiclostridium sp.]|nr:serine/threonine protein kinase [Ruminiclostridium sp.]
MVGRKIDDRYSIVKRLGGGAFGDVYLANEMLNEAVVRRVALKILKSETMDQEKLKEQFNDCTFPAFILDRAVDYNAKKHFVQIYNWGFTHIDSAEKAYIAMELVADSESLQKIIDRNKNSCYYPEASYVEEIMLQLFKGLALAHEFQVVHSDVKPDNLLLSHEVVRIVDFGMAMGLISKAGFLGAHGGTILYMAPETFLQHLTLASDVYSAGLVIYELWTNFHPFEYIYQQTDNTAEIKMKNYTARKQWKYIRGKNVHPDVKGSDKLDYILSRCLSFNPQERYKSAAEVVKDIEGYIPAEKPDYAEGLDAFAREDWPETIKYLNLANLQYAGKDVKKLDILEKLGLSYYRTGNYEEAIPCLLEAYLLDEGKILLTRETERRGNILTRLSECYSRIGQMGMSRIYKKKIGTYSGQGG